MIPAPSKFFFNIPFLSKIYLLSVLDSCKVPILENTTEEMQRNKKKSSVVSPSRTHDSMKMRRVLNRYATTAALTSQNFYSSSSSRILGLNSFPIKTTSMICLVNMMRSLTSGLPVKFIHCSLSSCSLNS